MHARHLCHRKTRHSVREIHLEAAELLLLPALSSRDPEVRWRLAEALLAQGRLEETKRQLDAARFGFDQLLGTHLLAFADRAAAFYAGSGNDLRRALELARANVANRPTRLAVKQLRAIAMNADVAAENAHLSVI